ncbi:MAG: hypothetical protein JWM78_3755 [Verrucomicrobiaceae bacterium]|nr:hypothetical protein [Verrucomicrobiaceae bacterium]
MPHYRHIFLIAGLSLSFISEAHAAEWRACEKAKLRQLDLQQSKRTASPSNKRKSSRSRGEGAHDSAEQLEDWLWKNCRQYSYELRTLEQQRM